jgi:hypothetical protein
LNAKFIAIALVTLVLSGLAWKVSRDKAPQTEIERVELFPGLLDRLNDVAALELRSAEHSTRLARGSGDTWGVANKDGYPATFAEIKRGILQVAGLVTVEAKTARRDSHARIGVADLDAAGADGTLVEAFDAAGERVFGLIVGHARDGVADQHYVRRLGEDQAWLVAGKLALDADPIRWLDARIADVDTARVRRIEIAAPDEPTVIVGKATRKDSFFTLENVPDGYQAKSKATVSAIGAALLDLRFNDVASAAGIAELTPVRTITIETFDGLVAELEDFDLDGTRWVRFAFRHDPALVVPEEPAADDAAGDTPADPEPAIETAGGELAADAEPPAASAQPAESVADEAARLASRTSGWIYVLPDYKRRMIDKRLADLIEKPGAAED